MDRRNNRGAARRGRDKQPTPALDIQAQPNPPKDLRVALKLSMETLELVGKLLSELPYKVSQPIIADLSAQIDVHNKKEFLDAI